MAQDAFSLLLDVLPGELLLVVVVRRKYFSYHLSVLFLDAGALATLPFQYTQQRRRNGLVEFAMFVNGACTASVLGCLYVADGAGSIFRYLLDLVGADGWRHIPAIAHLFDTAVGGGVWQAQLNLILVEDIVNMGILRRVLFNLGSGIILRDGVHEVPLRARNAITIIAAGMRLSAARVVVQRGRPQLLGPRGTLLVA